MNCNDSEIKNILTKYKQFTVYGLSPDTTKPSYRVPFFMHNKGYQAVGVYPGLTEAGPFKIYPDLKSVPPAHRKFVDVFRRSEKIPQVIDEILAVGGVEVVWLQLGISNPEAEKRAEAAGLRVISDRCLLIEYEKHFR